jgi:hypothetical protein
MNGSYRVDFTLTGTMPILFHADDVEAADDLSVWRKDDANKNFSKAGDDRSPPWTWATYLYADGGNVAWPSANIMVGLRSAGAQIILKKQTTFKQISQSGILIDSEFCDFYCGGKQLPFATFQNLIDGDKTFKQHMELAESLGFRLYVKRAKVGQSKHVRVRARFDDWTVRGSLEVLAPEIEFPILERMFTIAGRLGQGDWRPGCKTPGPFGQFTAELKKATGRKAA